MTDLETGASIAPLVTGFELATLSTPLRRAAGRLQAVLPPGWRVEIVDAPGLTGRESEPVLRVVMPTD
ncbi:hypothetical protein [Nocardia brasiliensis]|uniref:Uncharacterized protein n=1 Tax=Nocardia brasiliensis (strain ATCC 700358 / HUJEG-1) TaxID=1133849 RepID=K0F1K1_NOCB7|nr:hypothetical protein [Nocardia brasiliensis]AFU06098.1 hypothetical protein O3I_040765 [Nocardia brasiliensis ATCC 700358]OCF88698.1 hypothetical protein AW168_20540 [Nocardia brasiliensis]